MKRDRWTGGRPGRPQRPQPWQMAALAGAFLLFLAATAGRTLAAPTAKSAKETVVLSGETVEYDVDRRMSVVTSGPGAPATLVSGQLIMTGSRLEYSETTGQVKVEGGVRLEQTSPDPLVLTARTLLADVKARTVHAQGEVRLVSGKAVATAENAFFQGRERSVLLSGAPVVRVEESVLQGKEIHFSLADQKATARGGSRVTVPTDQAGAKSEAKEE